MGSSLESCSKLEDEDCSFQERESLGSLGICSCFRATISKGTIPSSQISYYNVNKGLRMCRQLVSLEDNSILGKHPISISSGSKFQTLHIDDTMMDQFPPFLLPAFSFPLLTNQGVPTETHSLLCSNDRCSLVSFPNANNWLIQS